MAGPWITVFETAAYLARATKLLSEDEQRAVTELVARDPTAGALIEGTGGVRKLRFAVGGRGFHSDTMPVYLLALFEEREGEPEQGRAERARWVGYGPEASAREVSDVQSCF